MLLQKDEKAQLISGDKDITTVIPAILIQQAQVCNCKPFELRDECNLGMGFVATQRR
jgi:hypothetical protein